MQFLTDCGLGHAASVLWIATVFALNNLVAFLAWTLLGDRIAARFRDEAGARTPNMMLGAILAGIAVWMLPG